MNSLMQIIGFFENLLQSAKENQRATENDVAKLRNFIKTLSLVESDRVQLEAYLLAIETSVATLDGTFDLIRNQLINLKILIRGTF